MFIPPNRISLIEVIRLAGLGFWDNSTVHSALHQHCKSVNKELSSTASALSVSEAMGL